MRALKYDSLKASHPIQVQVQRPSEIDQIFDAISYCKGASLIRMLRALIGPKEFDEQLRQYLEENAFSNATTNVIQ